MARLRSLLVLAPLALAVVACSSGDSSSTDTTTPGTAAPSTTVASSTTHASTTTTGPASSTTTPAGTRCQATALAGSLGQPNPGAGQLYIPVVLENTSSAPCTLTGFPGVSLLDAGGGEIGQPATREEGVTPTTVTLAPGASASAALHTVNAGMSEQPCLAPSTQVRVFPPDDTVPVVFAGAVTVCGGVFQVGPVVPGAAGR